MIFSSSSLLFLGVLSTVHGHADHRHHHRAIAHQLAAAAPPPSNGPPSSSSVPGQAVPLPAQPSSPISLAGPVVPSVSRSSVPSGASTTTLSDATLTATNPNIPPLSDITSGQPSPTPTFTFQETLGIPGPFPGAPPLPSTTLDRSKYPSPTELAPTDHPLMAEWLKELEGVQIPDIPPTTNESVCSLNPEAASDTSRCWWTCGGCTNPVDIVTCPDKETWGVTFDDGPSPYSPLVHQYLAQNDITATFFAIGGNVYWYSNVLVEAYMGGHQIGVHTWRHPEMTTLSTLEVIAELGMARQIIKDTLGVTPTYWRPPYGDVDERVRAIALAMGMQTIIWTRDPLTLAQYDTNDWRIPAGEVTGEQCFEQFETILQNSTHLDTGFIVLEHDLFVQTVELATGYTLPAALSSTNPKLTLKSVVECQHLDMTQAYNETRTQPLPSFVTSWKGRFITIAEVVAQSNMSSSSSGSGGSSGSSGSTGSGSSHSSGLALTASLKHILLVLAASTFAIVLSS